MSTFLDQKAIESYLQSEGGGRYELEIRRSDGLIVISFYDRHGSIFDVVDAADFQLAEVREKAASTTLKRLRD